jgi:hypothetical protein
MPPASTLRRLGIGLDAAKPVAQQPQPENNDLVRIINITPQHRASDRRIARQLARLAAGGQDSGALMALGNSARSRDAFTGR